MVGTEPGLVVRSSGRKIYGLSSAGRRYGEDSGLESGRRHCPGLRQRGPEPLIFAVYEEKRPILDNGTTKRESEIVSHVGILWRGVRIEKVACSQRVVPSEPISVAVKLVAPSPSDHVNNGSGVAAILGIEVIGDDPELLSRIRIRAQNARAASRDPPIIVVHTIEKKVVITVAGAVHRKSVAAVVRLCRSGRQQNQFVGITREQG